jgi:trehalose 6-phosphate phosphatase
VGDDVTDLDAFTALRRLQEQGALEHAVCVGVSSEDGPADVVSEADLVVDGTDGVRKLLGTLAAG